MTLIELLIALVVLAVGIAAIVAGFSSGILAVNRASQASKAAVVADQNMETYRRGPWSTLIAPTYSGSWTCAAGSVDNATNPPTCDLSVCSPGACTASGSFWVLTMIGWACGNPAGTVSTSMTCSGSPTSNPVKTVSILVRSGKGCTAGAPGSCTNKLLVREDSTFDPSTS
jgi:type II secretory pathway pseudopilin PulG